MITKATSKVMIRHGKEPKISSYLYQKQSFCGRQNLKKPVAPFLIWWLLIAGIAAICYVSS